MKYIITEQQYKLLTEDRILKLDFDTFNNDWELLQKFLDKKGNPPYMITGDLYLTEQKIKSLGNLVSVEGDLSLMGCKNLRSLGNLQSVGGFLDLGYTSIKSLGNLRSVGKFISLVGTLISKKMSEEEIRDQIEVDGVIYL
jgi:hypothetical protein